MAGLDPAIHVFEFWKEIRWMPGTKPDATMLE